MNAITQMEITALMNDFPEVEWDRFTEGESHATVYGWIARDDGKRDFMLLRIEPEVSWYATSSAKFSKIFSDRIGSGNHIECRRVEDFFVNVRTLRQQQTSSQ